MRETSTVVSARSENTSAGDATQSETSERLRACTPGRPPSQTPSARMEKTGTMV